MAAMPTDSPAASAAGGELVITRIFEAPRELVWKAWTEPERSKRWWGPKGFTTPFCRIDLRVGGAYLYCMRSPEGQDYWGTGVYREIVPLERLVCTDSFADENGQVVPAAHYGMTGEWPLELLVTVTFEERDGKTRLTLRHAGLPAGEMREQCAAGWNESFDKLAACLAKEGEQKAKNILFR
ncbi:MAG TPA: SRPBCC domain-containing protein [Geobacteraceae bacterium]